MPLAAQDIRTFFVTSVTASRRRLFQVEAKSQVLLDVFAFNRSQERFELHSFVVMPDHIHLILTPAPEVSLEKAMQYIKGGFSFRLKSKMDVWERSFQEHRITDRRDYVAHRDYIEQNPVAEHLVEEARDYPWSSARLKELVDPPPDHLA